MVRNNGSGPGRPGIEDHLEVIAYVEIGRWERRGPRTKPLSVRRFCALRGTVYYGKAMHEQRPDGTYVLEPDRVEGLKGEALRRRYGKARKALLLTAPLKDHDGVIDPAVEGFRAAIAEMTRIFTARAA